MIVLVLKYPGDEVGIFHLAQFAVMGDLYAREILGHQRPRVGVLAVQGAVTEHEAALADVGARTTRVRTVDDLHGIDGLVIPGGESTTELGGE